MNEYQIVTDSSADLSLAQVETLGIKVLPLHFNINGNTYANDSANSGMSPEDFYAAVREGAMSTTSQVNMEAFSAEFKKHLDAGKDILYIGFSSGLSGTYNAGRLAAEELASVYPNHKIIAVDTLCASCGEGLMVHLACAQQRAGKTITEVAQWLEENKLHMAHWITVNDLNHLKRGGRVSGAAAMFGTMLQIKPILIVTDEGGLVPLIKARGRQASLDTLVEKFVATAVDPKNATVFISHADCAEDAAYLSRQITERTGATDIQIGFIGPVIGAHAGPGTVALCFLGSGRNPQ